MIDKVKNVSKEPGPVQSSALFVIGSLHFS